MHLFSDIAGKGRWQHHTGDNDQRENAQNSELFILATAFYLLGIVAGDESRANRLIFCRQNMTT